MSEARDGDLRDGTGRGGEASQWRAAARLAPGGGGTAAPPVVGARDRASVEHQQSISRAAARAAAEHRARAAVHWMDGWMDGWMNGSMDGQQMEPLMDLSPTSPATHAVARHAPSTTCSPAAIGLPGPLIFNTYMPTSSTYALAYWPSCSLHLLLPPPSERIAASRMPAATHGSASLLHLSCSAPFTVPTHALTTSIPPPSLPLPSAADVESGKWANTSPASSAGPVMQ
ncbi:hypothetical protein CDD83_1581 [Cordyceps sp. RAO-2017]|nr:hypothetical protein CDD83_1581 [Cordyceps sp. RAO-2017]